MDKYQELQKFSENFSQEDFVHSLTYNLVQDARQDRKRI